MTKKTDWVCESKEVARDVADYAKNVGSTVAVTGASVYVASGGNPYAAAASTAPAAIGSGLYTSVQHHSDEYIDSRNERYNNCVEERHPPAIVPQYVRSREQRIEQEMTGISMPGQPYRNPNEVCSIL